MIRLFSRLLSRQPELAPASVVGGTGEDRPILDEHSLRRELASEMARAKRGSRRLSIVVAWVGRPGQYDFVSQGAGDPLLERLGGVFVEQKRQVDVVAALGQGRFVLILPETGEPGARVIAARLREAVAAVFGAEAGVARIGFGVASFGRHGRTANALLRAAERAARAAKEQDREPLIQRHELADTTGPATRRSAGADTQAA
jgi:diguanylate cyclase (GGDEF)-like protein